VIGAYHPYLIGLFNCLSVRHDVMIARVLRGAFIQEYGHDGK
jgi:hypothetical protein